MGRDIRNKVAAVGKNAVIDTVSYYATNYINGITPNNHMEYWQLPFTKQRDASESYIWVTGILCGEGQNNYPYFGVYCTIDNHGRSTQNGDQFGGVHGCGPDGNNDREGCLFLIDKTFKCSDGSDPNNHMADTVPAAQLGTGNHNITIGHCTRNNDNARPTVRWNPDSSRESRHQDTHASFITIMEMSY